MNTVGAEELILWAWLDLVLIAKRYFFLFGIRKQIDMSMLWGAGMVQW